MRVLPTLKAYMTEIEKPAADGLGITAMLGFPDFGRTSPALPVACLVYQEDGYMAGPRQVNRIGQVPPTGEQIVISLFVVATDEQQLLGLVDALRDVKATLAAVVADSKTIVVRYGVTRRTGIDLPERQLAFVAETQITFTGKD